MGQKLNPIVLRLNLNKKFDSCWFGDYHYNQLFIDNLIIRFYLESLLGKTSYSSNNIGIQYLSNKLKIILFWNKPSMLRLKKREKKESHLKSYIPVSGRNNILLLNKCLNHQIIYLCLMYDWLKNTHSLPSNSMHMLFDKKLIKTFSFLKQKNAKVLDVLKVKLQNSNLIKSNNQKHDNRVKNKKFIPSTTVCKSFGHVKSILNNKFNCNVFFYPIKVADTYKSAAFIATYIVKSLEKYTSYHKIFRHVITNVKSKSYIKGIRVSCSGRLNGVEMARTQFCKHGRTSLHVFSDQIDFSSKNAQTSYGLIGVKVWVSYS